MDAFWNQGADTAYEHAMSVEGLNNLTKTLMEETVKRIQAAVKGHCNCGFQENTLDGKVLRKLIVLRDHWRDVGVGD